jgi:hypothetical protein
MAIRDFSKDDLRNTSWLGEVVDIEDPQKIGRIKVKVFGKFDELENDAIPWAYPGNNISAGSADGGSFFSVPKKGSIVSIKFDNGNIYYPEYFFNQHLSQDARKEIENSYTNAHIIVYDTVTEGALKIFFTEEKGLMIDYKKSQINIKPDKSIIIQNASGKGKVEMLDDGNMNITQSETITAKCKNLIIDHASSIELGKGAKEHLVLGDTFMDYFNTHTHIGNLGAPTSPPTAGPAGGMKKTHLSQMEVKTK